MSTKFAIGAGLLVLLLGTIAPSNAQETERGNQKQQQQQKRPVQQQQQRFVQQQQQSYGSAYHGGVQFNGPTHGGVHHSGVPQQPTQVQAGFLESRSSSWDKDHQSWSQRGGYNGYRIPENRFRQYFGSTNVFVIDSLPMVFVGGYPRFQYDGYWLTLVDPWPELWGATWFQTDEVYVDYNTDGYYLYNRSHPGVRIALTISF